MRDWRVAPACLFVAVSILYLATTSPGLTWAHGGAGGGELITAAWTLGIPHPTGFPTYVLLGKLFTLLPYGSVAWRLNLLSALAGAGAAALTVATIYRLIAAGGEERLALPAALLAGCLLATGRLFWSQAVIAEVYALHALFVALALYLVARLDQQPCWRTLFLLGSTLGLGLGNHPSLALLLPSLAILAWPSLRRLPAPAWLNGLAGLLLGLAVYLYLPFRAWQSPPLLWGEPDQWKGLVDLITGATLQTSTATLGAPLRVLLARLPMSLGLLATQFTWAGAFLVAAGFYAGWHTHGRLRAATGLGVLLYSLYALSHDAAVFPACLLPACVLAALWLAEGSCLLAALWRRHLPWRWMAVAAACLVALALTSNGPAVNLRHDREAENYALTALRYLPPDAVICTATEAHASALWYAQWVLGPRPRWAVVDARRLSFAWYQRQLRRAHPDLVLPGSGVSEPMQAFFAANRQRRPIYLADPLPASPTELLPASDLFYSGPLHH